MKAHTKEGIILATQIKFGTDGWRGRIADNFTFENVRIVAQAIADYFSRDGLISQNTERKVIVGYDTRFLSDKYALTIARILAANNLGVIFSREAVPSPVVSYWVVKEKARGAVMVTASHNPPGYNGIKIKNSSGGPADENITGEIEKYLYKNQVAVLKDESAVEMIDLKPAYLARIKSYINLPLIKKNRLKIVVDSMYGAGRGYIAEILKNSPVKVIPIHQVPDPLFGGINPEPIEINLAELKKTVREQKADIGLATDGDADRIGIIDDKGNYLTPHQVFPLLLSYLVEEKKWQGKIVQAISLGYLGKRIAGRYNLPFQEVGVGFKNISSLMVKSSLVGENEVLMGGEESGGYGYKGYIPERDGILSGLLMLEMLAVHKQKLSRILALLQDKFGHSFYERIDVRLADNTGIDKNVFIQDIASKVPEQLTGSHVREIKTFDGLKIYLEDDSWLLIRPSGTEPILRIYAEAESKKKVKELINAGIKLANYK
jgi:phosphomannomutase